MYGGKSNEKQGLLLNIWQRKAGDFVDKATGQKVEYDAAEILTFINWGDDAGKTVKYKIAPEYAQRIKEITEPVCWGCLVQIKLENKQVVDLKVISDVFADYIKA